MIAEEFAERKPVGFLDQFMLIKRIGQPEEVAAMVVFLDGGVVRTETKFQALFPRAGLAARNKRRKQ